MRVKLFAVYVNLSDKKELLFFHLILDLSFLQDADNIAINSSIQKSRGLLILF